MEVILTFLIYKTKSADGFKDSMHKFIDVNNQADLESLSKLTLKKYRILKWRMKISCMALLARKTVKELFLDTILKTY